MDFEKRLKHAINKGRAAKDEELQQDVGKKMSEEEFRNLHLKYRLELTEHIDACLKKLTDHFPGFQFKTLMEEDGWGSRITRDDVSLSTGKKAQSLYSRLEMIVRPFTETHIIELVAKATIRNKETYNRSHYQFVAEADMQSFQDLIDIWILEFAEEFSFQA
ncbi:MAG: hypothetical protein K0U86_01560 [Planctomycetes bacterium]|nr:hypothetical protein [Planctomycetota bacterium]MCH9723572.1 hypothetical protein [Planctomycetota bacterium]MCH9775129.1 hypothetical protein [Planctomycetota bacterium]MCH9793335.1 hypothetical protein [Planctomycetota bacterium]MDF1746606.1 hypothetical protein [Gimesia sp.]